MDYIRFAILNPVKVTVGVMLILLFGLIAVATIPIQLVPNVDQPVITVETAWTGRSPQEVEQEIIEEQEDKLKSVSNLKKMTGEAQLGRGEITLEFYIGTNMDRALQEVSDKLREVPEYPEDVDQPVVTAADNNSENAIAWMILDSDDPNFDIQGFYDIADKRIKPYLERVAGLSRVNIFGGRERQALIRVNPAKMAQRGVTFNDLRDALQRENVNVSAGDLREGRLDVRVRTVGQYADLEAIRKTVVAYTSGGPVRVSDLGDVWLGLEKRRSFVRANGNLALALNATREAGSNVIQVMEGLRQRIATINREVLPAYGHGLELRQVYDETTYIYDALDLVTNNLWMGGTLAIVVLLLFLRKVRPTVIVAMAIPISVVGTFVVMTAFGRNLNVISLAGLAFAVGMVVDSAIVVLENIDRHLDMGKAPLDTAYDAAKEVWGAVFASTLTTLAVFIPVLTIQEEAGQLFRDIALALCAAVTLSLIISVTVIPTASARWLKRTQSKTKTRFNHLLGVPAWLGQWARHYANLIYWLTGPGKSRIGVRLCVIMGFTLVSVLGVVMLTPDASYLPNGNKNLIFGIMLTPPAYNIQHNQTIGKRIERSVQPYWEANTTSQATDIQPVINFGTGQAYESVPPIENYFFVSFGGTIFMGCSSQDKELVKPLESVLNAGMSSIPGSFGFAQQSSIFGRGVGGGNTIDVEVMGFELDSLRFSADVLYQALAGQFGYMKVRPDPLNFNLAGPELQVKIDQIRAKDLNVDVAAIGLGVQAVIDGATIGDYRLGGESIDLVLTSHPDYSISPDTLGQVPFAVRDNEGDVSTVPLSAMAQVSRTQAPQQINRIEQMRAVTFSVTPSEEMPLETAMQQIEMIIQQLREVKQIDRSVEIHLAGTADKLVQVRRALIGQWSGWTNPDSYASLFTSRMFLALLVTFLLMAALFESFLYPFVIMFSVPLAVVGGVLGLAIVRLFDRYQQLDVLTMLGFVILIGVVVNNAILIVHQALNFMKGLGQADAEKQQPLLPRNAISEAVRTRIRPIFMTTMTSVCGMLPLVIMPGSGSELYRGLGSVVVGGLLVATVFTLVVVPLVFSLTIDLKIFLYRKLKKTVPELAEYKASESGFTAGGD